MHQWWGDNVSEGGYNLTFYKEGLATLGEYLFAARNAADRRRRAGPPAGDAAFETQPDRHVRQQLRETGSLWTARRRTRRRHAVHAARRPTPGPGTPYIALRQILGTRTSPARCSDPARVRRSSITEAELEAGFDRWLPNRSAPAAAARPVLRRVVRHRVPARRRGQPAADHRSRAGRSRLLHRRLHAPEPAQDPARMHPGALAVSSRGRGGAGLRQSIPERSWIPLAPTLFLKLRYGMN